MPRFRLPNFRAPSRDRGTDQQRLMLVLRAVRSAVATAEKESKGIRSRLETARRSAAFVDDCPEVHLGARDVEQQLLAAEKRLAQLKEHLALLQAIESTLSTELARGDP
jgi:hypothetical protein